MRDYRRRVQQANRKAAHRELLTIQMQLPMAELIAGLRPYLEAQVAEISLTLMQKVMEAEIQTKLGVWGQQPVHRHGHQPGYAVVEGRKVSLSRPRLRSRDNKEIALASYKAFQSKPKMQSVVTRLLARQCSSRDYEGAINDHLKGYGIKRSSISRYWKAATEQELKKLCERPVPTDIIALLIDSKFFAAHCVVTTIGLDEQGKKHLLGLWHGATENTTVVSGLLEDLVARGLPTDRKLLVVIDGAKALRKAVTVLLGDNAIVQRCRVHKQRNVLDHLPEEKKGQAAWRLQAAWAKKNHSDAEQELRKIVQWLRPISPMAARSLEEGLEETLTLQKLGINQSLGHSLSSTNIIENCFSQAASWTRRVKQWTDAQMVLRWSAAAFLWAEKTFKRIDGCKQMKDLVVAIRNEDSTTTSQSA
jgi:transposase-like protein